MPLDPKLAASTLNALWEEVLESERIEVEERIEALVGSNQVSIRYALPTQLLGKLVDPVLDALCLQKGDGSSESMWDPRGFASKVIVPWVSANQNVLGTSDDPYVSKPLRKPRIEDDPQSVKNAKEWQMLHDVLLEVQNANDPEFTRLRLKQTLASIRKKLAESTFEFYIPPRVSLRQTIRLMEDFLCEGSGGDRGLAISAALFSVIGDRFGLYKEVRRAFINASEINRSDSGYRVHW
ncbi:MAG: restriction endonuclease, SacI family [Acidobacteria bacterium]|nr:restriction endonuclease, SacI family [Acidobacteriota bacterium]